MIVWRILLGLSALLMLAAAPATAQTLAAKPLDPVTAIIGAFQTHDVVALGEGNHNNEQGAAFRMTLFRDPRFQAVVQDIVVEAGNGRRQPMMDRYLLDLAEVPEKELRLAWMETGQAGDIWDKAIWADMYHSIRDLNRTLPKDKRLRVLLGSSPFFPENPTAPATDRYPAELVLNEVLGKKRKALIVYGELHLLRKTEFARGLSDGGSLMDVLEAGGAKVFSVWTHVSGDSLIALQADVATWPAPSLAILKGTPLGAAPFSHYYPKGNGMFIRRGPDGKVARDADGKPVTQDIGESVSGEMQGQFEALLYLGPSNTITYSKTPPELCSDPDYVELRAKRLEVMGRAASDGFRARCKAIAGQ